MKNKTWWVTILIAVSFLSAALSFFVIYDLSVKNEFRFPSLTGDSNHYRILAENLISKQAFDRFPDSYSPEDFRTPGYPLFLALLFLITGSWVFSAFLQSLIMASIPILTYFLGEKIFNARVGLVAGFIVALDPLRHFFSSLTLSDAPFTALLLAVFVLFFYAIHDSVNPGRKMFMAGLVLGFAVLVRPIGQFLPIFFILFWFVQKRWEIRLNLKPAIIFLAGFLIVVGAWSIRNQVTFGTWEIASVSNYNIAYYAELFEQERTGVSLNEQQEKLASELGYSDREVMRSMKANDINIRYAKDVLFAHPFEYTYYHLVKTIPFFLNDGLRDTARLLGLNDEPLPNFTGFLLDGEFKKFFQTLGVGGVNATLLIMGSGFMFIFLILAGYGALVGFKNRESRLAVIFFVGIIFYFALVTGPVSTARYRLPVMPFITILAVSGFISAFHKIRSRSGIAHLK